MKDIFTTKRLCRAGIIAALYVALTYAFMPVAYQGILEIRPAEALTVLPLLFPEAVPALWIGCMIANVGSPFIAYDVPIGGLATLVASLLTYGAGRLIKHPAAKVAVGGIFPVIVNAFVIPLIIVFLCGGAEGYESVNIAYWAYFGSLCATEALWVYALGTPLIIAVYRLRQRGISAFCDGATKPEKTAKTYVMNLNDSPFEMIKSGQKTIELRLNDQKRKNIKKGDLITFQHVSSPNTLNCRVIDVHKFNNFEELYSALPLTKCGYTNENVAAASPADMHEYYTDEQINKNGVLGIEIEVVN